MDSDGGSRSLHSGIAIPQWMKNKITDTRFEEAAFSPPDNDDSFLYIRYPQEITRKLKSPALLNKNTTITIAPVTDGNSDINHTDPCRQYILKPGYNPTITVTNTPKLKIKSNGVDDGFTGEGAACGSSVIRVAHKMVSGRYTYPTPNTNQDDSIRTSVNERALRRRGSRSLPASPISSPLSSPKSKKRIANKYFTGAFVENENHSGSWLLQGLLSKREASQSTSHLATDDVNTKSDLVKAVSELHIHESEKKPKAFKAKPSEFREMNFWSPTSM